MRRIGNRVECGRRSSTIATRAGDTARTCRRHGGRDRIRAQREVGDERVVLRADCERERIGRAAALHLIRLGPLVGEREGNAHLRSHLFEAGLLDGLADHFMGVHA